jgi:hypothetical protein
MHIGREAVKNNYRGNKVLKNIIRKLMLRIQAYKYGYIILEIRRNGIVFSRATNKIKGL